MSQNRFARFATTAVALFVVLSTLTAPVAATSDDGGLLGDDDDDDDGGLVSNTTDAVTDTVDSTTDTVSETTGTDELSDTTDTVTDTVDSTAETVDSTTGSVSEPTDTTSLDSASPDDLAFGDLPDADGLVDPGGDAPTDPLERDVSTDDLPVGVSDLPIDALPVTGENAPVQPEDSPYGSEGKGNFNACQIPADENDLPLDSVPTPGEIGVPAPPGVPLDLLTPQAAAGLVLGVPPRPCEVYDPHDPSLDPMDPGDPKGTLQTEAVELGTDRAVYFGGSNARVDEFNERSTWIVAADDSQIVVFDRMNVRDGTTRHYLFLKNEQAINYRNATGGGDVRVGVLGRHVAFGLECGGPDLANASVNVEDPGSSGPCQYTVDGLPALPVGPDTVIDAIENPPAPPELPGAPGIGDLPSDSDSMVDL